MIQWAKQPYVAPPSFPLAGWSEDEGSTWCLIWGTINAGVFAGNVTTRNLYFNKDILVTRFQVTMSFAGLIPVQPYTWEMITTLDNEQNNCYAILPGGGPTVDKTFFCSVHSDHVNDVDVMLSHAADAPLIFSGTLFTTTAPAIQLSANIFLKIFYKVKN